MKKKYFTEEEKRLAANEWQRSYRQSEKGKIYYKQYQEVYYKEVRRKKADNNRILAKLKSKSKRFGYEFNLDLSDIVIPEYCPVLGIKLSFDNENDAKPSIDRIDNTKGYVKGNIIVVSGRANRIKSDATLQELNDLSNFYNNLNSKVKGDDK